MATKRSRGALLPWLGIAAIVVLLDQFTKTLVMGLFALNDSHTVTSVLNIVRVHNTGAAFSFLAGPAGWLAIVLYVLAAVMAGTAAVGFCPLYALFGVRTQPAQRASTHAAEGSR